ncbi:unnamed protein product [Zymoseptoria tritici ST99CH_1E4]|uniref:ARID domain-containing protein n=1 Tax=Zymoseptoria tritici ST99CH_1E4 TaxID=1276532 RepID=A0A2H1GC19_ZYMTR|nr:unnamed protein product [Zymoseptoria tritici ST99CH_1E4]
MAPKRGLSIEPSAERDEFIRKLKEYHEKRGTNLDLEPKIGIRHIDIHKLYERVVEEGGYDLVSDTKAKPLMWRKLAEEFIGKNQYTAAQAFQIKNVYYKNLCAYEISTHWKQEPPPKEILEDVTAKGANVMTRTLENFVKPLGREQEPVQNGDGSDASPEQKTPKEEKIEVGDEPGSAAGRSTRGLRQQPPQRQLFQPEANPGRNIRTQGQIPQASPTPHAMANGTSYAPPATHGASATLASYEPSQAYPLSLKPVITPANNPEFYRNERKRKLEASSGPLAKKYKNIMLPGTGFIGPNIYVRAQLALQSGIADEEQYALHHLVKISHERGEKFRFDQFPGLADALVKKVISVTSLFYDIDWDVMYDEEFFAGDDETLNGLDGTPDIVQRLNSRVPVIFDDTILDSAFLSKVNVMTEAALITRNMCLQEENALYMSRLPLVRDLIAVVLHMPDHVSIVELRQYVLDIAEQVLKYIDVGTQDALYQGLLRQITGSDRGAIVTAFKTVSRIAMTHRAPKRLDDVPLEVLKRAQDFLLVEDEELRSACLDFFMQFTSISDNVEILLRSLSTEALGRQLSRLVLFNAKEHRETRSSKPVEVDNSIPPPVPRLSTSLVEGLLKMEEPERSSEWLRMCFVADPNAEMTQISLWQSYQSTFGPYQVSHPHLIAGEFIKNVSTTFQGATAQVAGSNKYVIRGIKSRNVPVDTGMLPGAKATDKGKDLHRCHWAMTVTVEGVRDPVTGIASAPSTREQECAEWFRSNDDMLKHILNNHLQLPRKAASPPGSDQMDVDSKPARSSATPSSQLPNGANGVHGHSFKDNLDFEAADKTTYRCRWAECQRSSVDFPSGKIPRTTLFARHIETHLPETEPSRSKHNLTTEQASAPADGEIFRLTVLEDERGDAAGVPLRAALVLRNIAKFMPRKESGPKDATKKGTAGDVKEWPEDVLFSSEVRERLFYAMSYSKTLRDYMGTIFRALKQNGG